MDASPNKGSLLRGIVFPNILSISLCHSCFYPDALCPSLQPKIKTHSLHKEVDATHVKGMSMYTKRLRALVSPLLYMTLENRCLGTAYTLSEKKKICVQSKQQHSALLGSGNVDVWEEGKRQGGREIIRDGKVCQGGRNCVKVTIFEILPFKSVRDWVYWVSVHQVVCGELVYCSLSWPKLKSSEVALTFTSHFRRLLECPLERLFFFSPSETLGKKLWMVNYDWSFFLLHPQYL